jgi:Flp pilus assembly secretin CpaC
MTDVCVRGRASLGLLNWLAATVFVAAVAAPALAAEPIVVRLDQATLFNLPPRATTVVIGNPLIADISLQPGGLVVVTGKGYGATNVIVLDHDNRVLMEHNIEVKGPSDPTVVLYAGIHRYTFSCTPECSRRITLGDAPEYFSNTLTETTSRNDAATGAAVRSGSGNGNNQGNNQANNSRH